MCDESQGSGLVIVVEEPVPTTQTMTLFCAGVGTTVIGIILIILAALADCQAMLHAITGALLATFGVVEVAVGLASVRQNLSAKKVRQLLDVEALRQMVGKKKKAS